MELMIHILGDFNDDNILTTLKYKPKKIIFIRENTQEALEIYRDVKSFLREKLVGLYVDDITYDDEKHASIIKAVDSVMDKNPIIHLTEDGNPLLMVILAQRAWSNGLKLLVSDCENEEIYEVNYDGSYDVINNSEMLKVKDLILATGGEIVTDTTKFISKTEYFTYVEWIVENYKKYKMLKKLVRNTGRITVDPYNIMDLNVNIYGLSNSEKEIIIEHIEVMKKRNWVTIINENKGLSISLKVKNENIKSLFICGGLWLEILTYRVIKEQNLVDDIKVGVRFIWDRDTETVENELDIMFTKDNKLFCVSCKDTPNYESAQLNELKVYSDQIGGQDSVKALVTTKDPKKVTVLDRASEMNIDLIIFDGDIVKFRENLINLVNEVEYVR